MERVLNFKSEAHHYRADACVVWCFDARFSDLLEELIAYRGYKYIDLVKVAGGAKSLASGTGSEQAYILDQVSKSINLHNPKEIILMAHKDCGAYAKQFQNSEDELIFYGAELNEAMKVIEKLLQGVEQKIAIKKYFADFDGLLEA